MLGASTSLPGLLSIGLDQLRWQRIAHPADSSFQHNDVWQVAWRHPGPLRRAYHGGMGREAAQEGADHVNLPWLLICTHIWLQGSHKSPERVLAKSGHVAEASKSDIMATPGLYPQNRPSVGWENC